MTCEPIYVTVTGARGAPSATTGALTYTTFGASLLNLASASALSALVTQGALAGSVVRGSAAVNLAINTANFFTGAATVVWALPAVAGNAGAIIWVKNQGSAALTVGVAVGGDRIFDAAAVASLTLNPGDAHIFLNDGYYWNTVG